jgi:hypothetical protein
LGPFKGLQRIQIKKSSPAHNPISHLSNGNQSRTAQLGGSIPAAFSL